MVLFGSGTCDKSRSLSKRYVPLTHTLAGLAKECFQVVCFPGRSILHVLFDKQEVAACSEDYHIAFMKYDTERVDT